MAKRLWDSDKIRRVIMKKLLYVFIAITALALLSGFKVDVKEDVKEEKEVKKVEVKEEKEVKKVDVKMANIKNQFSVWNGEHRFSVKIIKKSLNNSSSFKHFSSKYLINNKDELRVFVTYRATNAFGALIKTTNGFVYDLNKDGTIKKLKEIQ